MKHLAGEEKKTTQPGRVREDDYAYIEREGRRSKRFNFADEVALMVELHKRMRELFGTDDPDFIAAEVERLRKLAKEQGICKP